MQHPFAIHVLLKCVHAALHAVSSQAMKDPAGGSERRTSRRRVRREHAVKCLVGHLCTHLTAEWSACGRSSCGGGRPRAHPRLSGACGLLGLAALLLACSTPVSASTLTPGPKNAAASRGGGDASAGAPSPESRNASVAAIAAASATGGSSVPTVLALSPVIMPVCPFEGVLSSFNPLDFPGLTWGLLNTEQQAMHPINLVFMNMAGVPSTERAGQITPCLSAWGIKRGTVKRIKKTFRVPPFPAMNTEVLVMRTSRDVFVVFRATDDDWVADFNCMYTESLNSMFNAPPGYDDIHLHKGFYNAYKVVGQHLEAEIKRQLLLVKALNPLSMPAVWFIGHSLGGALGSIAALRLTSDPLFVGRIGGIVSYGMPRVGNEAWASLYNSRLRDRTLRWANYRDFVTALPRTDQVCVSTGQVVYSFRHIGRAAQLCPGPRGLERFVVHPGGTEGTCTPNERPSIPTHLLSHYFDGWRRAYADRLGVAAGLLLSTGLHVRSVMCAACATAVKPYPLPNNKAARNDGVVTCTSNAACSDRLLFGLVSWSGIMPTSLYREDAVCDPVTFTCQVPIPGLQAVTSIVRSANNITLADLASMADLVLPDAWANASANPLLGLADLVVPGGLVNTTQALLERLTSSIALGATAGVPLPGDSDAAEDSAHPAAARVAAVRELPLVSAASSSMPAAALAASRKPDLAVVDPAPAIASR